MNYKYSYLTFNFYKMASQSQQPKIWSCVKNFVDIVDDESNILNVHCGNQKNTKYMLDNCQNVGDYNVLTHKYTGSVSLARASYDYIVCIGVIQTLKSEEERHKIVEELVNIVKQDGVILLSIPSFENRYIRKNSIELSDQEYEIPNDKGENHYCYFYKQYEFINQIKDLIDKYDLDVSENYEINNIIVSIKKN